MRSATPAIPLGALVVGLLLCASVPALPARAAPAPGLVLEAGDLSPRLAALVRAELPDQPILSRPTAESLVVRVARRTAVLDVEIRRRGARVLRRQVTLARGLEPALRVVALVVAEAAVPARLAEPPVRAADRDRPRGMGRVDPGAPAQTHTSSTTAQPQPRDDGAAEALGAARTSTRSAASRGFLIPRSVDAHATEIATQDEVTATPATPAAPRLAGEPERGSRDLEAREPGDGARPSDELAAARGGVALRLEAALLGAGWQRPVAAQPGLTVGAEVDLGPLAIGLAGGVLGLGCCALGTASLADGRASEAFGLATAGLPVATVGPVAVRVEGGVGIGVVHLEGRATVFAGPSPLQSGSGLEGLATAGVSGEVALGPVRPYAAARALLRVARQTLRLPEPYAAGQAALDPGLVTPWLEVGAHVDVW